MKYSNGITIWSISIWEDMTRFFRWVADLNVIDLQNRSFCPQSAVCDSGMYRIYQFSSRTSLKVYGDIYTIPFNLTFKIENL